MVAVIIKTMTQTYSLIGARFLMLVQLLLLFYCPY